MRMVIEAEDFKRLSPATQRELLRHFAGDEWVKRVTDHEAVAVGTPGLVDLAVDQVGDLISDLPTEHRRRLQLFAQRGGRVRMSELLSATGDAERRSISRFQCAVTQKLRAVLDGDTGHAQLIGWDPSSTQWDERHADIIDGVYYVSGTTAQSLRSFFHCL